MGFIFQRLSYHLREHPLVTNLCLSTTIGFCGDVVCQTVYEPWSQCRPPLTRKILPSESAASPFLREVTSPYLYARAKYRQWKGDEGAAEANPVVLVDFRRSMIFCSFTFIFGVPYFLWVYRKLDGLISPVGITKRQAIVKGFLSYLAAQTTNPIFLSYVTAMDHFFIYRDGRDGRRRVMEMASTSPLMNRVVLAGEDGYTDCVNLGSGDGSAASMSSSMDSKRKGFFSFFTASNGKQDTVEKMGHHYRFVHDKSFNLHEFATCIQTDVSYKLRNDFPDIMKYGFVFWGMNWLPMFYYIPSHFRLAYSSSLQVVWSGIMSHLMHRQHEGEVHHEHEDRFRSLASRMDAPVQSALESWQMNGFDN